MRSRLTKFFFACHGSFANNKGTIWLFWIESTDVQVFAFFDQFVHIKILLPYFPSALHVTVVYASCDDRERRDLWEQLHALNNNCLWMVAGDFNIVPSQEEKIGGCSVNLNDVVEFLDMIQQANILNAGFTGPLECWFHW